MIDEFLQSATNYGKLYSLLYRRLPAYRAPNGRLNIAKLAGALRMNPEGVYLWLRADSVSRRGRDKLIALSAKAPNQHKLDQDLALKPEDFIGFC